MIRVAFALFFGSALLSPAQALLSPAQVAAQSREQTMTEAAAQLAARISSLLPRRSAVSLEIQNLTSLPAPGWSNFRKLLQDELHKAGVETSGVETTAAPPETRVRVTLSEDARGWLFVAEVASGDNRQVAMLPWAPPSSAQINPRVGIGKKLLWTQPEPVLDVLLGGADSEMLLLSPDHIASYRLMADRWTQSATASLVLPRPMPRDPRGRLEATPEGFRAYLPAATCEGTFLPALKVACANGTGTWTGTGTRWVADRNVLEGDAPAPSFEGWGSDWTSIADPCGAGTVEIASSPNSEHDSVRAYLIQDGRASPVSDALPLPGPVTALWPGESGREATLVVHNLQTGEYEASRLLLACTH